MRHEKQVEITRHLFQLMGDKMTDMAAGTYRQAKSNYTSEKVAESERLNLFRGRPLLMCLSCDIPEPGDYFCEEYSEVPVVVVRNGDGGISAYINICSHRGARVVQGRGQGATRFTCPYHAWSYKAETGELVGVPFDKGIGDLNTDDLGLVAIPVDEKYGLIFARLTPGEQFCIDEYLGDAADDMKYFDLGSYHHYETRVLKQPLNWKLVIDTFLETYHLNTLHRDTVSKFLHSNLCHFEPLGLHLRMTAARKTINELKSKPEQEWDLLPHSALVYVLFPNTVFIMQGDHLETWRVFPGETPGQSVMRVSLYPPSAATTEALKNHWDKNMDLLMATVLEEDFPLATNIQKDFAVSEEPMIFCRNEPALQHFHKSLACLD